MLHDGKTKPRAAELSRPGFVDPIKPLEDPILVLLLDADAGIGDGEVEDRSLRVEVGTGSWGLGTGGRGGSWDTRC